MFDPVWTTGTLAGYALMTAAGMIYLAKRYRERKTARLLCGAALGVLLILGLVFFAPRRERIGYWLMMPMLATIATEDILEKRISNRWLMVMLAVGLACALVDGRPILPMVVAPVVYGAVFLLVSLVSRGALGMGDAKLIAVISVYYGIVSMFTVLFAASAIACVCSLFVLARTRNFRSEIPFAPAICFGALIALIWVV